MHYQQLPSSNTNSRGVWASDWSTPVHIAANQQGGITPQQRAMLKKLPFPWGAVAFLGILSFLLFVPSIGLAISQRNNTFLLLFTSPLALALIPLALYISKRSRILRAAEAGLIQQVQGEVVWDEKRQSYILHTPTEQLTAARWDLSLPPPGPYHFYYLAEGNILLSAQPIRTSTQALVSPGTFAATGLSGDEQARLALQQALHHALGFSPSDLASNRTGRLSSPQRRKFTRKLLGKIVGAIVGVLFGLGVIGGLSIYAVLHGGNSFFFETSCFSLVGLLVFLGSLFYLIFGVKKEYAEIRQMQDSCKVFECLCKIPTESIVLVPPTATI